MTLLFHDCYLGVSFAVARFINVHLNRLCRACVCTRPIKCFLSGVLFSQASVKGRQRCLAILRKKIDENRGKLTGAYNVVFFRQVTERHVVVCLVDVLLFHFVPAR